MLRCYGNTDHWRNHQCLPHTFVLQLKEDISVYICVYILMFIFNQIPECFLLSQIINYNFNIGSIEMN